MDSEDAKEDLVRRIVTWKASTDLDLLFFSCVSRLFQLVLLCTFAPLPVFLFPFLSQSVFVCPFCLSLFTYVLLSKCLPPNLCLSVSTRCCGGTPPLAARSLINTAVIFLAWMEHSITSHLPDGSPSHLSTCGGVVIFLVCNGCHCLLLLPRLLCCMWPFDKLR